MRKTTKDKYLLKAVKDETIFLLSVLYRWFLFLYAFFLFIFNVDVKPTYNLNALLVAFVFFYTLLITVFFKKIFLIIKTNSYLVIFDIVVCFFLLYSSGGWGSQFYFYSFSPVFIASFLFEITGGFIAAFVMCGAFNASLFLNGFTIERIIYLNRIGDFLLFNFNYIVIALIFGYMSSLLNKVRINTNFMNKLKENLSEDSRALKDVNNKLNVLLETISAIQITTNLDSLTELILKTIAREFDFDRVIIAFWDEENEKFLNWRMFTKTDFNSKEKDLLEFEVDKLGDLNSIFERLFSEKKLHIVKNAENEPFISKELTSKLKISSYIISPLVYQEKLIGIVEADNFLSKKQIANFNIDLLECFLKIASIGICNARLFEIKKQKVKELSSLSQSISSIHLKSELKEAGWTVFDQLKKYFNFERIEIDFVDRDIPSGLNRAFEDGTVSDEEFFKWWEKERTGVISSINKDKKLFMVVKNNHYAVVNIDDFKEDFVFGIAASLIVENRVLGFVSMLASKPQRINLDDLRILTIIINQATMALQNILLNKKTKEFVLSEERNRLARDLHDNTAQLLAIFLFQLSFYKNLSFDNPSRIIEGIDNLEKLIANALIQSYCLIFSSEPQGSEKEIKETFIKNLRKFIDDFYNKFLLKVYLDIKGDLGNLPVTLQIGILPIIREALYNVVKHACAKNADVKISVLPNRLEVAIKDDGCGFDLTLKKDEAKRQKHFGLLNMEERSKALGGSIIFKTGADKGTEVVLDVPIDGQ
ncbi:MAG: hypothetical protein HY776_02745 [Actinobacteria bacterium]|nr:hypothetical protein [Actinomycetota bacterium]